MDKKDEIVQNWLPRYTGTPLDEFGEYILLVNFANYVETFAAENRCSVRGQNNPMQTATSSDGITIINFGIGSPNAATVMDLLSAVKPKACLFLGKCGALKEYIKPGNFILPIGALREGSASVHYFPPEVPALPSFNLQKTVAQIINRHELEYYTGTVYSTNRRVWEHDVKFKEYLTNIRAAGIDMETSTIFLVGFANHIPKGALLLVSDNPMLPEGIKTDKSDAIVTERFLDLHLQIGVEALRDIKSSGQSVKHLKF
ncbi:AMP nucleosidase [candidate division KSB1 bacterium]|nr:MAG: AMP nucleosidase [candidate division KSB1 bacterium]